MDDDTTGKQEWRLTGQPESSIDRQWRPSTKRQSTVARNFSAALDEIFDTDNSGLESELKDRQQAVDDQSAELSALAARLRETEDRLKAAAPDESEIPLRKNSQRRTPVKGVFAEAEGAGQAPQAEDTPVKASAGTSLASNIHQPQGQEQEPENESTVRATTGDTSASTFPRSQEQEQEQKPAVPDTTDSSSASDTPRSQERKPEQEEGQEQRRGQGQEPFGRPAATRLDTDQITSRMPGAF
ncbi:hypothetical protein H2199_000142 [Coniosporium tulheliwenetii]|uniref:Uncharacterized protein n=1 Tax=Coniosporium tulheliwenetii TaxID=3383036 RepID=A0ACC2ZP23_9PEZI|nr:hypothetical protein H2199_000142 [Cladosporium sp. JES 115]